MREDKLLIDSGARVIGRFINLRLARSLYGWVLETSVSLWVFFIRCFDALFW